MIKSEETTSNSSDSTGARLLKSWSRGQNVPAIEFELQEEMFIFPYQHLVFVNAKFINGEEVITATFASHEVTIRGRRLQPLRKALREFTVETVAVLPGRAEMLPDDTTLVIELIVRPLNEENNN